MARTKNEFVKLRRREQIKNYLRQYPHATISEVQQATGCSSRLVSLAKRELVAAGELQFAHRNPWKNKISPEQQRQRALDAMTPAGDPDAAAPATGADPSSPVSPPGPAPVPASALITAQVTDQLAAGMPVTADLTPKEMQDILARIARNPLLPPNVRIQAVQAKTKLDYDAQDRNALGPGPPLTREDALRRLAALMEAFGPDLVRDAITLAFSPRESADGNQTEAVDPGHPSTPPAATAPE